MITEEKQMLRQDDARWGELFIVPPYTIRDWGCTITSLCRLHFAINGKRATPADMVQKLEFNNSGMLIWASLGKIGLQATRHKRKPTHEELTQHTLPDPRAEGGFSEKGMLLELDYLIDHWVSLEKNSVLPWVLVMDPLRGHIVRKLKWDIMGFSIIEKA